MIFRRRSIRAYSSRPVEEEKIRLLLMAGMYAPSAGNQRPWHFVVARDPGVLEKLSFCCPNGGMMKDAALGIVVCCDMNLETRTGFWVQDCSAATQNILLEATELGLGAVWIGTYPRESRIEKTREVLSLPQDVIPLCLIAIGYPGEEKETPDRWEDWRVHFEKW